MALQSGKQPTVIYDPARGTYCEVPVEDHIIALEAAKVGDTAVNNSLNAIQNDVNNQIQSLLPPTAIGQEVSVEMVKDDEGVIQTTVQVTPVQSDTITDTSGVNP